MDRRITAAFAWSGLVLVLALTAIATFKATRMQLADRSPIISIQVESNMVRVKSRVTGQSMIPGVDIFADGRCDIRRLDGEEQRKRLKPNQVRDLIQFMEREGLFSITDQTIQNGIDRERGLHAVTHGNYTRLAAHSGDKSVAISRYALDMELKCYPEVTDLKTVHRCVQKVYAAAGVPE